MQMNPLKQLWGENPLCPCYNGGDAHCCYSGQSFWWRYYVCRAAARWKKQGTAALSSLAHLPTYNIHDHAVYFHINKAHPFKLGCEFNLEAGLSAISDHYLGRREKKYSHSNRCLLIIFVIFNSCLAYFLHVLPENVETITVWIRQKQDDPQRMHAAQSKATDSWKQQSITFDL